jgi:hypothetical protein
MTALTVIASVVAYLVIGAVYARANAVNYYRRILDRGRRGSYSILYEGSRGKQRAETAARFAMAVAVFFWPLRGIYDLLRGPVAEWARGPVERSQGAGRPGTSRREAMA